MIAFEEKKYNLFRKKNILFLKIDFVPLPYESSKNTLCVYDIICYFVFSVKQKTDLPEPVSKLLQREMEKFYNHKDPLTLNTEYLEQNNNSILHRLAGMYRDKI